MSDFPDPLGEPGAPEIDDTHVEEGGIPSEGKKNKKKKTIIIYGSAALMLVGALASAYLFVSWSDLRGGETKQESFDSTENQDVATLFPMDANNTDGPSIGDTTEFDATSTGTTSLLFTSDGSSIEPSDGSAGTDGSLGSPSSDGSLGSPSSDGSLGSPSSDGSAAPLAGATTRPSLFVNAPVAQMPSLNIIPATTPQIPAMMSPQGGEIADPFMLQNNSLRRLKKEIAQLQLEQQKRSIEQQMASIDLEIRRIRNTPVTPQATGPTPEEVNAERQEQEDRAAEQQAKQANPSVAGVYIGSVRRALVTLPGKSEATLLQEGGTYGNYLVERISISGVKLSVLSNGRKVLTLDLPVAEPENTGGNQTLDLPVAEPGNTGGNQ